MYEGVFKQDQGRFSIIISALHSAGTGVYHMEGFGAHDCGQCARSSAYHHRSGLYVQLFFEHSHKRAFGTAWTYGFSSGHMVSGAASGGCEPDTYCHRCGAHFSQHKEYY